METDEKLEEKFELSAVCERDSYVPNLENAVSNDSLSKAKEFLELYNSKEKLSKKQLSKYYALKNAFSQEELSFVEKTINSESETCSVNGLVLDEPIENFNDLTYSHLFFKLKLSEKQAHNILIEQLEARDYYAPFVDLFKTAKSEMFYLGFGDYSMEISTTEQADQNAVNAKTVTHYWERTKGTNTSDEHGDVYSPFDCDALPHGELYEGDPVGCKGYLNFSAFENAVNNSKKSLLEKVEKLRVSIDGDNFDTSQKTNVLTSNGSFNTTNGQKLFVNVKSTVLFAPIYAFKVVYHGVSYHCYVDGASGIVYSTGVFSPEKDASCLNYYKQVTKYNLKIKHFIGGVVFIPILIGIIFTLAICPNFLIPTYNAWWQTENASMLLNLLKTFGTVLPLIAFALVGPISLLFYFDPAMQFIIEPKKYFPCKTINGFIDDGSNEVFHEKPFKNGKKIIFIELAICVVLAVIELLIFLAI